MPITLSALQDRLKQILADTESSNIGGLQAKVEEFFQYSVENYDQLDEEAKSLIDQAFASLQKQAKAMADALPDGPEKRRISRQVSLAGGGHFQAENLMAILESPPQNLHPILQAAREAFGKFLQSTLDVLFDVTRHSHQGAANFALIGLCYWAIDELLASIRLAQCAFTNQSYAHIRTCSEILDLIELFSTQPEWATLWVSGKEEEVWWRLKPPAVRKKLGEPKADPMYSFLSAHGSHGTFRGLQARSGQVLGQSGGEKKRLKIWVGGSPMVHHIVWTNSLCVYTALQLLVKCERIFHRYLNADEMEKVIQSSGEITGEFFRTHYIEWAKGENLNWEPVLEFLSKAPWGKS